MGATMALPLLDAMVPAMKAAGPMAPRFAPIYFGNGANMLEWTPAADGVGVELSPTLQPLEAFRDRTLVFTGLDNFPATDQGDVGGQHPRAAPAFMSCMHPKQTEGAEWRRARRSIRSSPNGSAATQSCGRSKSLSTATTSSARATTGTPAPT